MRVPKLVIFSCCLGKWCSFANTISIAAWVWILHFCHRHLLPVIVWPCVMILGCGGRRAGAAAWRDAREKGLLVKEQQQLLGILFLIPMWVRKFASFPLSLGFCDIRQPCHILIIPSQIFFFFLSIVLHSWVSGSAQRGHSERSRDTHRKTIAKGWDSSWGRKLTAGATSMSFITAHSCFLSI